MSLPHVTLPSHMYDFAPCGPDYVAFASRRGVHVATGCELPLLCAAGADEMILRVLDLLCSIPAALVLLCALASLTFLSAGVYGFQSRRVGRIGLQASGRPASAGEDGMVGELCAFVLKGYGFALLLGVLFRDLGGVVAACIGSAVLAMGEQRQDYSLQVLRPADVLDADDGLWGRLNASGRLIDSGLDESDDE